MRLVIFVLSMAARSATTLAAGTEPSTAPSPGAIQFFETRVRPVLVERCYNCHSAASTKLKADLYVDSLSGLLKGGESGPALVPGHPEQSKLIEAIGYGNVDLQMPPKDKLPAQQIADLTTWVKDGAAWPTDPQVAGQAKAGNGPPVFDLARRKADHWAWQPVKVTSPPAVSDAKWVRDPVDQFLLAGLEARGLHPAPAADRRTLIRRVTFDLIGLPPTDPEVDAFLNDTSPSAVEHVVDRLLASPRFGERWARHWLDLARYAETLGHEFDYVLPNAWRYRDYVIRAFNADVPYNQFVLEQIAGDLLPTPRRDPATGNNESVIGTGFQYFGESVHSPVDVRQNQADLIDNRIDVTGKAILGMTVACARCHDHKFDAIGAADYYAFYGMFESTRYAQRSINDDAIRAKCAAVVESRARLRQAVAEAWAPQAAQTARRLLAARRVLAGESAASVAAERSLRPAVLDKWLAALKDPAARSPGHPASAWVRMGSRSDATRSGVAQEAAPRNHEAASPAPRTGDVELADFSSAFGEWASDGVAFGNGPSQAGEYVLGSNADRPIAAILNGGGVASGTLSHRLEGTLRSPTFVVDRRYLFVHASGHETRINVCVEGLNIIRAPIYGGIKKVLRKVEKAKWIVFDLEMWKGRRAYIELADCGVPDPGDTNTYAPAGWLSVDRVVASDEVQPPPQLERHSNSLFGTDPSGASAEVLADRYQTAAREAVERFAAGTLATDADGPARIDLLNWLVEKGLFDCSGTTAADRVSPLLSEIQRLEQEIPEPVYVPGASDGNGIDERVFIRGNYKSPGAEAPRRPLEALGGSPRPTSPRVSGRLEIAQNMIDPANPLVARVMVNRVWHHLFGAGLVASTDNFGVLGEKPSNPALLDFVADRFVREGWSIKRLIRELVLTSAYLMASRADAAGDEADPVNRLLHRMNLRRLESEAIRDEMLAVSGRLNLAVGGPGVDVHLTPFMEGRGRPHSGPLDGDGRRSIYLSVKRNFLSPMLLAFDTPIPFSAMGRRSVSNVPAQALILMNDPFVAEQARQWASRVLAENVTPTQMIERMYRTAFARPPTQQETRATLSFIEQQTTAWGSVGAAGADDPRVWADLAHVLMNTKEFIFIN